MGQDVEHRVFTREDRTRFRGKVRECLDVFARMLGDSQLCDDQPHTGIEIEFNLVDHHEDPALRNADVLKAIADPDFQTELGQFNIEINIPPRTLQGKALSGFETAIRASLNEAESKASAVGTHLVMVGILPTVRSGHMTAQTLSANPRYELLSDQILAARGEDIRIDIDGRDKLSVTTDSIIPEAACTSTQLHVQVSSDDFAAYWNASQAIAGVQLAVGANSPFLLGKELWRETRIALFEQATDTRSEELKAQGVRPRVWFGERWINSIFDLFEENVRYFPALLPITDEEDPAAVFEAGGTPGLSELRLHNGTIYRWNRPHLRRRERPAAPARGESGPAGRPHGRRHDGQRGVLLRAGPSTGPRGPAAVVADVVLGRGGELPRRRPEGHRRPAVLARARLGPGDGAGVAAIAPAGACRVGLRGGRHADRDRFLGIIEQRCVTRRNGATWLAHSFRSRHHADRDPFDSMREVTKGYRELMNSNEPAHTWPES
jgi:hypothetical protein